MAAADAGEFDRSQFYKFPYQPFSRAKTSYSGMNDWYSMQGRRLTDHVPVRLADGAWTPDTRRAASTPYKPFVDTTRTDEFYKRYLQLSQNVAHRYPDPGPPKERQGAIGASWRHIKEVQGYNNRVLFVDGLVSLYDRDHMNGPAARPRGPLPVRKNTPLYAANRHDVTGYSEILERDMEQRIHQASRGSAQGQGLPPINSTTQQLPGSPSKYKGFYTVRQ